MLDEKFWGKTELTPFFLKMAELKKRIRELEEKLEERK